MTPKTKNIGIMFADVAGSTQLFEVLGDDMARTTIAETLELLTNVVNSHNGTVIKTIGDEVMCTFPEADDSANAATEMHETLEDVFKTMTHEVIHWCLSDKCGVQFDETLDELQEESIIFNMQWAEVSL